MKKTTLRALALSLALLLGLQAPTRAEVSFVPAETSSMPMRVTLSTTANTQTNQTLAEAFHINNGSATIQKVNLSSFTQVRLLVNRMGTNGDAAATLRLGYVAAFSVTPADYVEISTTSTSVDITNQNTYTETAWVALAAGARADVFVTMILAGGDGVLDPVLGSVVAEFR